MFKEELMTAVRDAVSHYNGGMEENDAVIKAASSAEFNPEQTQRLVESFNTTKTICFLKNAADKTKTFPLADGSIVANAMFAPDIAEKVADDFKLTGNSNYYNNAPKVNGTLWDLTSDLPTYKEDTRQELSSLKVAEYQEYSDIAKTMKEASESAELGFELNLQKVAADIRRLDNPKEASHIFASFTTCGDPEASAEAMSYVQDLLPEKVAAYDGYFTNADIDYPEIYNLFKQAVDFKWEANQMSKVAAEMDKARAVAVVNLYSDVPYDTDYSDGFMPKELLAKSAQAGGGRGNGNGGGNGGGSILSSLLSSRKGGVIATAGEAINKGVAKEVGKGIATPLMEQGSEIINDIAGNPQQESDDLTAKSKKLYKEHMLTKLIATDPVLRGANEELVARTFVELDNLAPEITLHEPIVKSILREAVNAEALSPYDAKANLDLNEALKRHLKEEPED